MIEVGSDDLVICTKVTRTFALGSEQFTAVQDVNLRVRRGSIVTPLGPSGCGKSTLLNLTGGLTGPTQGQVIYDGRPIDGLNPRAAYPKQADHLLPWRSVGANIAVPMEVAGVSRAERRDRMERPMRAIELVDVFTLDGAGGNPCPIVLDAQGMSSTDMQDVARSYGHESGFVLRAEDESHDFRFRFFVPEHEMEMCGHATIGALWLLYRQGRLSADTIHIATKSGTVTGLVSSSHDGDPLIEISQPKGWIAPLPDAKVNEAELLSVLGITTNELAALPIQNACTSRVKTLVPLRSSALLDALKPDFTRMEQLCDRIGSTGLYPYALVDADKQSFDARQFPKSSGYPEDAATGIAAAALAFGLLENNLVASIDRPIRILQGRAMGQPSEITVRFRVSDDHAHGCWICGHVRASIVKANRYE
jgi:PhzF family phenazine biosynthesis protein